VTIITPEALHLKQRLLPLRPLRQIEEGWPMERTDILALMGERSFTALARRLRRGDGGRSSVARPPRIVAILTRLPKAGALDQISDDTHAKLPLAGPRRL
jgi:hypothetical protein